MESKPKTSPEFDRFTALVDQVLAVPHSEILRRQEAFKAEAAASREHPKPKKIKRPS